jgi:hypothetical protein
MKAIITVDVPEHQIGQEVSVYFKDTMMVKGVCENIESTNATNGEVLLQVFPPSVYYGDDEKHIVLLTKDCELTCYNNDWWNAPYERSADENDN